MRSDARARITITLGLALLVLAAVPSAADGGRRFEARLDGASEVPGPGDPDGSGKAVVRLNAGQGMVCYTIEVADIATPTAAHIHVGFAGVAGGVVVPLNPPTSGCVIGIDSELIRTIAKNPAGYYVNVHNADFPPGAVRGQLSQKAVSHRVGGVIPD